MSDVTKDILMHYGRGEAVAILGVLEMNHISEMAISLVV